MELMNMEMEILLASILKKSHFHSPNNKEILIMMTDAQLHNLISKLKDEGISFKYIALISNIDHNTFYAYRKSKHYPLYVRPIIEEAIRNRFGDMIDELCK